MIVDEDACDFLNISEEGPWGASPILDFYPFLIFLHHLVFGYLKLASRKTYSNFIRGVSPQKQYLPSVPKHKS